MPDVLIVPASVGEFWCNDGNVYPVHRYESEQRVFLDIVGHIKAIGQDLIGRYVSADRETVSPWLIWNECAHNVGTAERPVLRYQFSECPRESLETSGIPQEAW